MTMKSILKRNAERARTGTDPVVTIEICTKCGWWCRRVCRFSNDECDPKRGRVADKLTAALPDIPATKLGYGFGKLIFEPVAGDADFHVRFDVYPSGKLSLEDVWLLGRIESGAAADLVTLLAAWRARWSR